MSSKIGIDTVLSVVQQIFETNTAARDSYEILACEVYRAYGFDPEGISFKEAMDLVRDDRVPTMGSWRRCSQKIQEDCPHLRGVTWEDRQRCAEEAKFKRELREMKRRLKDDAKIEQELSKPDPVPDRTPWEQCGLSEAEWKVLESQKSA